MTTEQFPLLVRTALWACLVLLPTGCGGGGEREVPIDVLSASVPATTDKARQPIRLGAILPTFRHPFFIAQKKAMEMKARELGVAIEVRDCQNDDKAQIAQMDALFKLGCIALIVCARDEDALVPAVEAANRARLPVIALNRRVNGGQVVCYVGADESEGGKAQGQLLADALAPGGGTVLYLHGPQRSGPRREHSEGLGAILDDHPEITLAGALFVDPERGPDQTVMRSLLRRFQPGQIQAIVAQSDDIALSAAAAARDEGWTDVIVIGFDGTSAAFDAISAGTLRGTILQNAAEQGELAVQAAVDYLRGKFVAHEQITPLPAITEANLDSFKPAY